MKCWTQAKFALPFGRDAELPAHVVVSSRRHQSAVVEWRIGEDVVGAEVGMEIAAKRVGVFGPKSPRCRGSPDSSPRAARWSVALLPVDADVADPAAVRFDELLRLHEHAARAAARVVDAAFVRREHLDEAPHDARTACRTARLLALRRWRSA